MIPEDNPSLQPLQPYPTPDAKQDEIVASMENVLEIQETLSKIASNSFQTIQFAYYSMKQVLGIEKVTLEAKENQAIWLETREGSEIIPTWVNNQTEAMDHKFYYVIREGKIWFKPIAADPQASWKLLGGNGFADKEQTPLISIVADGNNVVAIDQKHFVHYAKSDKIHLHLTEDKEWEVETNSKIEWTSKWFNMTGVAPILNYFRDPRLKIVEGVRSVAISHKGFDTLYYTDLAGKKHPDPFTGVTTLYALDHTGTRIFFADPWLADNFENEITGPEDGEFIAENMAASASTLFLIQRAKDDQGKEINKFYTRYADFDSIGSNPFLPVTYNASNTTPLVRLLPGEDWLQQPSIPLEGQAKLTNSIFILQTGRGQNQRQLRVLGMNKEGMSGYYFKNIYEDVWKFESTDQEIPSEEFLADNVPHQGFQKGPKITHDYVGKINCSLEPTPQVALKAFAERGLNERGLHTKVELTLTNGTKLELPLHARRGAKHLMGIDSKSKHLYWKLVIPKKYYEMPDLQVREALSCLFNNKSSLSVQIDEDPNEIGLSPKRFSLNKFKEMHFYLLESKSL